MKFIPFLFLLILVGCNESVLSPSLSDVSAYAGKAGTEIRSAKKIADNVYDTGAKPKDVQVAQLKTHLDAATKQLDDLQTKVLPSKQKEIDTLAIAEAKASQSALEAKDLAKKRGRAVWFWVAVSAALTLWITKGLWWSLLLRLIRGGL